MGSRLGIALFLNIFSLLLFPSAEARVAKNGSKKESVSIVFINPSHLTDNYWNLVTRLMSAAARDLDVEFEVFYSNGDRFIAEEKLHRIFRNERKPNYLIAAFPPGIDPSVLKLINTHKIPMLTLDPVYAGPKLQQAHPEELSFWHREYTIDQHALAKMLMEPILRYNGLLNQDRKPSLGVFGITRFTEPVALSRHDMIKKILADESAQKLSVEQVIIQAKDMEISLIENFHTLFRRFPAIRFLWTEGPSITGSFLDALHGYGSIRDSLVISSFDPTLENISGLEAGLLDRIVGGQFIMAVCAITDAFDAEREIEVNAPSRPDRYLQSIDDKSARNYAVKLYQKDWEKLDYRLFSRYHASSQLGKAKKDCSDLKEYLEL